MSGLVIQENIPLAPLTTFKAGGPARYFARIASVAQLQEAISYSQEKKLAFFILAGGSNLIISRRGYSGLVLHMAIDYYHLNNQQLTAGASTSIAKLVNVSIDQSLAGLEWAGGLPGSFGGAIRGNAGAFGGEMKDVISSVKSINLETGQEAIRSNAECLFGYRDSLFKHRPELIVEATVELKPGEHPALRAAADSHIQYRQDKHPMEFPSAGSIFKNTPVERVPKDVLPQFQANVKTDPFPVVPTAKIIADAGLEGLRVGDAQVSEKHTNYIVNLGNATGEEIVELITQVKAAVKKKFGISLEIEPELVGFPD